MASDLNRANEIWRDRGAAGYQDRTPYAIRMSLGVLGVVVLVVLLALSACHEDVDRRTEMELLGLLAYQGYLPLTSQPNEIPQEFLEQMARDLSEIPLPLTEDM